jgi:hypothetical protein
MIQSLLVPDWSSIPRHPNKEVERALKEARGKGWKWRKGGHWGIIACSYGHPECRISVYGTPRIPETAARRITDSLAHCPGTAKANEEQ